MLTTWRICTEHKCVSNSGSTVRAFDTILAYLGLRSVQLEILCATRKDMQASANTFLSNWGGPWGPHGMDFEIIKFVCMRHVHTNVRVYICMCMNNTKGVGSNGCAHVLRVLSEPHTTHIYPKRNPKAGATFCVSAPLGLLFADAEIHAFLLVIRASCDTCLEA